MRATILVMLLTSCSARPRLVVEQPHVWTWLDPRPQGLNLVAMWFAARNDGWIVGERGTALHWDGEAWHVTPTGTLAHLSSVWGTGPSDVWASGTDALLHFDGTQWLPSPAGPKGLWTSHGWAATQTAIYQLTNGKWQLRYQLHRSVLLMSMWADDTTVWAVGTYGLRVHFDGHRWTEVSGFENPDDDMTLLAVARGWAAGEGVLFHWNGGWSRVSSSGSWLHAIVAFSRDEVWALDGDRLVRWTGSGWQELARDEGARLAAIGGTGPDDLWIVGDGGEIARWHGHKLERIVAAHPLGRSVVIDDELWTTSGGQVARYRNGEITTERTGVGWAADVWGTVDDVWAVGNESSPQPSGQIARRQHGRWRVVDKPPGVGALFAIWGSGPNDVWAAGNQILHFDGHDWERAPVFPTELLTAIWGTGRDDVWVVGENTSFHYDGHAWAQVLVGGNAVWGTRRDDVWIVGDGFAIHWDGRAWRRELVAPGLRAITGTARDDIWTASSENVYHFDGESWSPTPPPVNAGVGSLVAPARGKVWLLGADGLLACAQPPPPPPHPPPVVPSSMTDMAGPFASIGQACQTLGTTCDDVAASDEMTHEVYQDAAVRVVSDGPDRRVYLLLQLYGAWYTSVPLTFTTETEFRSEWSKTELVAAMVKSGSASDRVRFEVDLSTRTDRAPDEPAMLQDFVTCGLSTDGVPRCTAWSTSNDAAAEIDFR